MICLWNSKRFEAVGGIKVFLLLILAASWAFLLLIWPSGERGKCDSWALQLQLLIGCLEGW